MTRRTAKPASAEEWRSLRTLLGHTFTPHKPIRDDAVFNGREGFMDAIHDVISLPGKHAVIYGDRGLGKSSASYTLERELLKPSTVKPPIVPIRRACTAEHTFGMIWHQLLDGYRFDGEKSAARIFGKNPNPYTVIDRLKIMPGPARYVFIIDEFDRVRDPKSKALLADMIKHLSDSLDDVTVIIFGVGRTIAELFDEHESLPRAMQQIRMPRMNRDELKEIVTSRLDDVSMDMNANTLDSIVLLSQGFPGYTHLLALHAGRAAISRRSVEIVHQDLEAALGAAVGDVLEHVATAYRKATRSARASNYEDVLLACALAETDDHGLFAPKDVGAALKHKLKREVGATSFSRNLGQFCSAERGPVLVKDAGMYSFEYGLLKPYVVLKALSENRIIMRQVR